MEMVRIQADDREQQGGILELLQQHAQVNLVIKRMPYGDYLVDNWLIVERKQIQDLITSIIDGRLFLQAQKLSQSSYQPLIIIEGRASDIQSNKMDRRSILGALASIGLVFGITVLRTTNQQETVELLRYAAQQKSRIQKQAIIRCGYRPKSAYKRQLYLLQGLPGVGVSLAKSLLLHFGSIRSVMQATIMQLQEVEGIGVNKAKQIVQLLDSQAA